MKQFLFGAALVSLIALVPVRADDPPGSKLLEETSNRAKVANQALRATVDDALSKAGKLPTDAALIVLQDAESQVKEATYLSEEERKKLLGQISGKIKNLSQTKPAEEARPAVSPNDPTAVQEKIHQELNTIRGLQQQGQQAEAQTRLAALRERYPNNPAFSIGSAVSARQQVARDNDRLSQQRTLGMQAAQAGIDKSASAGITESAQWPADFLQKTKDRQPVTLSSLTNREKQLLGKLDEKTTTDFNVNQTPFEQVLKLLEKEIGSSLVITKATMDDMRITYDSVLTYNMPKGVSKRTLLRSVLGELGLTYVVKKEVLQVMSILQAKNELVAGVLDIQTMVTRGHNPDDIIRMIKSSVEPDSWDTSGGPGTIYFSPPGMLIIRNSAEVIYNLGAKRK
jgi:hypothetical protein